MDDHRLITRKYRKEGLGEPVEESIKIIIVPLFQGSRRVDHKLSVCDQRARDSLDVHGRTWKKVREFFFSGLWEQTSA